MAATKRAAAQRKARDRKAAGSKKGARQARLPGQEDAVIQEIEDKAAAYVEIRDERQALTPREVAAKQSLLAAMHRHGKAKYVRDGITIEVVHEDETVRVRIKKADADA